MRWLFIVLMVVTCQGCSTIQKYNSGDSAIEQLPKAIHQANKQLKGRRSIVFMKDGRILRVKSARVEGEVSSWYIRRPGKRVYEQTVDIQKIETRKKRKWDTVGFLLGFAGGWAATGPMFDLEGVTLWEPAIIHIIPAGLGGVLGGAIARGIENPGMKAVYTADMYQLLQAH